MNPARAVLAVAIAAVVLVVGAWLRPQTPSPSQGQGDPLLIDKVEALDLPGRRLAVIMVDGSSTRSAYWGEADPTTAYEVGSLSKALTGLALADAIERGELSADDTLGELLGVAGPASEITLEQLATHHSGLPRLGGGLGALLSGLRAQVLASNPYSEGVAEVLRQGETATLSEQTFAYSNLGAALAGHAGAAAADLDFATWLQERLFDPLGLDGTRVQSDRALVEPGLDLAGRQQEPWVSQGYAPAGAVVSTPADLTRLVGRLLDGTAPGAAALDPIAGDGAGGGVGLFWFTEPADGDRPEYAWHNGGTGGYSSFLAIDRANGRAVLVLSDVADGATDIGRSLMEVQS